MTAGRTGPPRDAEVDQDGPPVRPQEHVLRFQIRMDDALAVQERQRIANAPDMCQRLGQAARCGLPPLRVGSPHPSVIARQRLAFEQLHCVPGTIAIDPLGEDAHDAGMTKLGQRVDLATDAGQARLAPHAHGLHGREGPRLFVLRPINDAHSSLADDAFNQEGADARGNLGLPSSLGDHVRDCTLPAAGPLHRRLSGASACSRCSLGHVRNGCTKRAGPGPRSQCNGRFILSKQPCWLLTPSAVNVVLWLLERGCGRAGWRERFRGLLRFAACRSSRRPCQGDGRDLGTASPEL